MLQPEFGALASLRHALAAWLERVRVDERACAEVVLAAHEAAANALEHGDPPVAVCAGLAGGVVRVEISDRGRWKVQRSTDEERGRGLLLIEQLVSEVEIDTHDRGTTLRLLYRTWPTERGKGS
jgi:anti-sigma regulatory factor (Ser/Thr protein kinase)